MKKLIALLLCIAFLLTGCGITPYDKGQPTELTDIPSESLTIKQLFNSLEDEKLLVHIEDLVYQETVSSLNSEKYYVENVSTVYLSKEYLEEVEFNSQSNIYFGYTLSELDELFQGSKYVFTLSETGTTTVQELQEIEDTSTDTIIKNVAIGTGVIFICVTVSVVSAAAGATAVSVIFATSAVTAEVFAQSFAMLGGVTAGIVRGVQTGDFKEAIDSAAMVASQGFKWGAITGAVVGGSVKTLLLKIGTKGGLTMSQVAAIQQESHYPVELISRFTSMEQYELCKSAGLTAKMVNGKTALIRKIDLNYIDDLTGKTNLQLMQDGYAPLDPTGKKYQLHHIGQSSDSPLAILTQTEHTGKGNDSIWHILTEGFDNPSSQPGWTSIREQFWKDYASQVISGVLW